MYQRLRDLREDHDKTQKDIASMLNISQTTYSRYESGALDIPSATIIRLARFYHVSTDYLISGSDIRPVEVSTVDSSMNERMLKYHLRTIYATLSLKSKQDLLEYARLLAMRDEH